MTNKLSAPIIQKLFAISDENNQKVFVQALFRDDCFEQAGGYGTGSHCIQSIIDSLLMPPKA